ncbi:MAG: methylated-DNA--[protein]-cysteine S-methyltransferase [Gemmatimonadales bacterium]
MTTTYITMASPVGELLLTAGPTGLTRVWFDTRAGVQAGGRADVEPGWGRSAGSGPAAEVLAAAQTQLEEYFAGTRTRFNLPLRPDGSSFQQQVWARLREIPFGTTISYSELARRTGDPSAVRAVGGANARNPLPIVVPCHRVIGADGSLTGFGGGIERKRWLLTHEGALPAPLERRRLQGELL